MTRIVSVFGPYPTSLALKSINIDLCFFGVIPRSIKKTWGSLRRSLLEPLETIGTVTIYVFNMNVGDTKVDGTRTQLLKWCWARGSFPLPHIRAYCGERWAM